MRANQLIRKKAKEQGVYLWQIADVLEIYDTKFSKKLRYPLNNEETDKILNIIKELGE